MLNILIISEEAREVVSLLRTNGFVVDVRDPGQRDALASPKTNNLQKYDTVLLDLDSEGWQQQLVALRQQMPIVAFSRPDVRKAVEAMRLGASDFIEKPLSEEGLTATISKQEDRGVNKKNLGFDELIGMSPPMQEVFNLIKKAAVSESNVLITGESGTGKEPVARAIHRWSPRKERLFMTINCSAIPDTLLESELFGFEKGAFTGANYTKKGILELADGGTVFFDEIGDVSPLFQTKILRVIQEGEIMRIGGMRHIKVDVRIIAATNKELKAACKKGAFREDLFYRLNVINIHLPPLRERMMDVPLLVEHFIKRYAIKRKDMLIKGISEDVLGILMNYAYPGNVRELENIIERAISFANFPDIYPSDLPPYLQQAPFKKRNTATPRMKEALTFYERELIWSALQESQGNISKAASALGIYRQQLQRKIKKLRIAT